jgi:TP901 family phage tail tape measure protein
MAGKGIQIVVGAEYKGKDLDRAAADIKKLQREALSSGQKLKEFGSKMSKVGKGLTAAVTLPLVAVGAAAVKMSVDFENSLAKIEGLVGIAGDEVREMGDAALAMSADFGKSGTEAADALFFITSAGLRGSDAMDVLEASMKASAVGLGETAVVADLATSAMNAYGSDVLSAANATDVMVAAVREGKLEASSLGGAMGRVLPVASAMGVQFHEVGAAFAALSRTGTNANEAATQLRGILSSLLKPTKGAQAALTEMGLSAEDLRDQLREQGLLATLQTLNEQFSGNSAAAARVFGNFRALSGVLDLMGANAATTEDIFASMADTAGITDEAFAVVAETTGFKLQRAMANFKNVLIEIGDILAPTVEAITDFFSNVMSAMRNLPDGAKSAIVAFAAIAAAIGPVLLIAGKLISAVGAIKIAIAGAGGFAAIAAAVTGPVAIIIAAIAGVIAIFVAMWRESETFRNAVKAAFEQVRDAVSDAVSTVQGALEGNADAINILRSAFKALGDFIGTYVIPIYGTYLAGVIKVVSVLLGALITYWGFLARAVQAALPYVLKFAAEVSKEIGEMVDFVLSGLEALLWGLSKALGWVPGIGDAISAAKDTVASFRRDVKTNMEGVEQSFHNAASAVEDWQYSTVAGHEDYRDAAVRSRQATDEYVDAGVRMADAARNARTDMDLLTGVTDAAALATQELTLAFQTLTGYFSETRAMHRAHKQLQDFRKQVADNTAGFDGYSDAAIANSTAFMDWADSQIAAAKNLKEPEERLAALKTIQKEARDALRAQGIDPKSSGFYQEISGITEAAAEAVGDMGDAVADAESSGLNISAAIAKGISEGMGQQASAINAAGKAGAAPLVDGMNSELEISSPSKVALRAGENVANGLVQGLTDMQSSISSGGNNAGRSLISGMIAGLDSGSTSLYARIRAIVSQAIRTAESSARSGSGGSETTGEYARGGLIRGRGGPMSDLIPAMLSNGEYVIRAQAVNEFGAGFFDSLNRGVNPLREMEAPGPSRGDAPSGGFVINGGITVNSVANEGVEESLPRALRRMAFLAGVNG